MTERQIGTLGGKPLWVIGQDDDGNAIYEVRGVRGARYLSERDEWNPNLICFRQMRDTSKHSIYGTSQQGSTVGIGTHRPAGITYSEPVRFFTDIDGPVQPIHELGWDRASEVPGAVPLAERTPTFDFF